MVFNGIVGDVNNMVSVHNNITILIVVNNMVSVHNNILPINNDWIYRGELHLAISGELQYMHDFLFECNVLCFIPMNSQQL